MTAHPWRLALSVQARDPERDVSVPVVAGLLGTDAGGVQLALQVGDGRLVFLAIQDARQLSRHLTECIVELLMITVEHLRDGQRGDGEP